MGNYLDGVSKKVCGYCGKKRTTEGHDGCIGTLKGVMNACCGHGEVRMAYVQFNHNGYYKYSNKHRIKGDEALKYIAENRIIV